MLVSCRVLSLLAAFLASAWSTSPPNYSNVVQPAISLNIVELQPTQPERDFDGTLFPKEDASIELSCRVIPETVNFALGQTDYKLVWILPNGNIIEEERAFTKTDSNHEISLLITNFTPDDGGKYICRLEVDGVDSGYEESIVIPALDGSPIIKCEVVCERNTDEQCQVLEYMSVICKVWAFSELRIECVFNECETREDCPVPEYYPFSDHFLFIGSSYTEETRRVYDHYATVSGLHSCRAYNDRGTTEAEIFVPVAAGTLKPNARGSDVVHQYIDEGDNQKVFSGRSPVFYSLGDELKPTCFTDADVGRIEWYYANSSTPSQNLLTKISNDTYEGIYVKETFSNAGHVSQLMIENYDFYQGGVYECRIKDGQYAHDFDFESHRWAADSNMNDYNHMFVKRGSDVVLRCTTASVKHDPDVYWKKDGSEEEVGTDFEKYEVSPDGQVLRIRKATFEDSGVYTCVSEKRIGIDEYKLNGRVTVTITAGETVGQAIGSGHSISLDKGDIVDNIIAALGTIQENLSSLSVKLNQEQECPKQCI